jgi:hypothetical protein
MQCGIWKNKVVIVLEVEVIDLCGTYNFVK